MLRRVKSDVENEMASKIELQEDCSLSHRQRLMYKALRDKLTLSDLSDPALSSKESLMNLVMQFRKVCNHPEIFDRRFSLSPFVFTSLSSFVEPPRKVDGRKRVIEDDWIGGCLKSPIVFTLPKLILDEFDVRHTDKSTKDLVLNNLCNIWFADYIRSTDAFGFLLLNGLSPAECEFLFWAQYSLLHMKAADIVLQLQNSHEENKTFCLRRIRSGLLYDSYDQMLQDKFHVIKSVSCFLPSVISTPPQLVGSRIQFLQSYFSSSNSCWERSVLFGKNLNFRNNHASDIHPIIGSHHIPASLNKIKFHSLYQHPGTYIQEWNGLVSKVYRSLQWNSSIIQVPDFGRLLADSGKMMALDKLLTRLKKEGRRVLIFSQMRKMIDILEDYMRHKKYKMFRLDGTTDVFDRRAMVNEFQESNDVFAFLLSTRAGGLGLTLTAVRFFFCSYLFLIHKNFFRLIL
jgi:DNA helicase INO80